MRESAETERMHLPRDTYEEWMKSQKEGPSPKGRGKEVTGDSFELWVAERVERQIKKAAGRPRSKGTTARLTIRADRSCRSYDFSFGLNPTGG